MQEYILIIIVLILLFATLRRYIYFKVFNSFTNAANNLSKEKEMEERRRKASGKITVEKKSPGESNRDGDFTPYEEVD